MAEPVRKLRSGKDFSPYRFDPEVKSNVVRVAVDLAPLLQSATEAEPFDEDVAEPIYGNQEAPVHTADIAPQVCLGKRDRPLCDELQSAEAPKTKVSRSHARRREKRKRAAGTAVAAPSPSVMKRVVDPAAVVATSTVSEALPAKFGAYEAKNEKLPAAKKRHDLQELFDMGFKLIAWGGETSVPIVDSSERIFVVLVGRPQDPSYAVDALKAYDEIARVGRSEHFSAKEKDHRRGTYPVLHAGITYGTGQTRPGLHCDDSHACAFRRLCNYPPIKRLALFASSAFAGWAPNTHAYYCEHLDKLYGKVEGLEEQKPFPRSVFPAATFNVGPNVWTYKHQDTQNCPFGWCAIQALGRFDPKKGGHLILWDLKLVVEFPPGALVLIPSATVAHSNIPVQDGDCRASFTQYCAGGLFRWVDNGYRTEKELKAQDYVEYQRLMGLKAGRWKAGLDLFSTVDSLLNV